MKPCIPIFLLICALFPNYKLTASAKDSLYKQASSKFFLNKEEAPLEQLLHQADSMYLDAQNDYQVFYSLFTMVDLHLRKKDSPKAIEIAQKLDSVAANSTSLSIDFRSRALAKMALVYRNMSLHENSLTYLKNALGFLDKYDKKASAPNVLLRIGILSELADNQFRLYQFEEAIRTLNKCRSLTETAFKNNQIAAIHNAHYIQSCHLLEGIIYYTQEKYDLALAKYNICQKYFTDHQLENNPAAINLMLHFAKVYAGKKNYDSAYYYISKGIQASEIHKETYLLTYFHNALLKYFEETGLKTQADSIRLLITSSETEKQNNWTKIVDNIIKEDKAQIAVSSQKQQIAELSLCILLVLLLVGFIGYKRKQRQKIKHYQVIIDKLKQSETAKEASIQLVSQEANVLREKLEGFTIRTKENITIQAESSTPTTLQPKSHNEISEEKEQEIMASLLQFEKDKGFLTTDLSISTLASILHTNTKYLTIILKKHRDRGFTDYINNQKINYIIQELYNQRSLLQYKISHLAELAGFSSHSRFTIVFKKETNLSPSEFIEKLEKESR